MAGVIKSKHSQLFIATAGAELMKMTRLRSVGFPTAGRRR